MCWAHVERAYQAKLLKVDNKSHQSQIILDLTEIQKSSSDQIFKKSINLFDSKWRNVKKDSINVFLDYFRKEWVYSTLSKWYEGFCFVLSVT